MFNIDLLKLLGNNVVRGASTANWQAIYFYSHCPSIHLITIDIAEPRMKNLLETERYWLVSLSFVCYFKEEKMVMKLYPVKALLFIMAENELAACVAATQAHFDIFKCAARWAENVNLEWKHALPYHADDDHTCSEIMDDSNT